MKIVTIPLFGQAMDSVLSRVSEVLELLTGPPALIREISQVSADIIELAWPMDEHSIVDLEITHKNGDTELWLTFHLSMKMKNPVRAYIHHFTSKPKIKISARTDEAIEIGEQPRYQIVFSWALSTELSETTIAVIQQTLYGRLGLSRADIQKLTDFGLTEILAKIRNQQEELQQQKTQIQQALSKIEHDLEAAREAQMNLLPRELIGVNEVEFRSRFIPSQYVSGDIYNVFRLDERHLGAYHIDISGHGVSAALYSVSLSQMLNTNISSRNLLKVPATDPPYYRINRPDEVFAMLDEDSSFAQYDVYFTMVYMVIDLEKGRIQYARAGHNPLIIIRADGTLEVPTEGSLPIGWGLPREDVTLDLELHPGDRLYVCSDGITEAFGAHDELFSQERLISILKKNTDKPLDQGLDVLLNELRAFTGNDAFEDDVSIISLLWKA